MTFLESKLEKLFNFAICARKYGWNNAVAMHARVGSTSGDRTVHFRSGGKTWPFIFRGKKDRGVLTHFWIEGYYIQDTVERPIRTIMDCGANIGDETMRFRLHYPEAEIIAVEADPENCTVLQRNFGSDPKTTVVNGAVWDKDMTLRLSLDESGNPEGSRVDETSSGLEVQAYAIPSLMKMRGWEEIDVLKLDIEGAEYHLFNGDTGWLEKVNALIFEVPDTDYPGTLQLIFEKLRPALWNGMGCGECLVMIRGSIPWKPERVFGLKDR